MTQLVSARGRTVVLLDSTIGVYEGPSGGPADGREVRMDGHEKPDTEDTEGQARRLAAEESEEDTEGQARRLAAEESEEDTEGQARRLRRRGVRGGHRGPGPEVDAGPH
jgi:hypothetical protein